MKKILFFNHKGGVSKTTSAFNIGWMLALKGKRVLLVDADPQCNLSALILNDHFEEYYINPETKNQNIKDGVKVAFEGKPKAIEAVTPFKSEFNSNLFLLPGHPNLTEYDPSLSFAQTSNNAITTLQNLPGAFNELIEETGKKNNIDFVLIDLNPGLSAINQNLFITSDAFIIPTSPDPFSQMAINTLSDILPRWVDWANRMRPLLEDASYPLPQTTPKFIGELIQRFNIRKGKAASPFQNNIEDIKLTVNEKLFPALKKSNMTYTKEQYELANIQDSYCLAEIPDFQSLNQKAHDANVPVFALTKEQIGAVGTVYENIEKNREKFFELFENIADKIQKITSQDDGRSAQSV